MNRAGWIAMETKLEFEFVVNDNLGSARRLEIGKRKMEEYEGE